MEKKMGTTIMGYIGTTTRIPSFILSSPKASIDILNNPSAGFHLVEAVLLNLRYYYTTVDGPKP